MVKPYGYTTTSKSNNRTDAPIGVTTELSDLPIDENDEIQSPRPSRQANRRFAPASCWEAGLGIHNADLCALRVLSGPDQCKDRTKTESDRMAMS